MCHLLLESQQKWGKQKLLIILNKYQTSKENKTQWCNSFPDHQ